jgi:DNA adenine methylase
MDPFLKAVGGKRWLTARLVPEILAIDPRLFVEPFVGGGALALALPPRLDKIVSDTNPAFHNAWRVLRYNKTEEILHRLTAIEKTFPNTGLGYDQARQALNAHLVGPSDPALSTNARMLDFAALTLYINVRCFNGMWRVNADGGFNVPWGRPQKPRRFTLTELNQYKHNLSNVRVYNADFRQTLDALRHADLIKHRNQIAIYADSPYDGTFNGYTSSGFDETDQRDLARWLAYLAGLGMRVWATNADTPLIREIYSWAKVEALAEYHSVGSKADRRGSRSCLLIRDR